MAMAMVVRRWPAVLIALLAGRCVAGDPGHGRPGRGRPGHASDGAGGIDELPRGEIIGMHGTGEGPSATDINDSPEIRTTFSAFIADERKLSEHGAHLEYYPYPTVSFAEYLPTNWPELAITINDSADELEVELESFSDVCPGTPISLVGYSLGALLIDNMLSSYSNEWDYVNVVELYGDPCWYNPQGGYRGLAQYAVKAGFPLSCFPRTHTHTRWRPGPAALPGAEPVQLQGPESAVKAGRRTRSADRSSLRHCAPYTRARTALTSAPPPATAPSFSPRTLLSPWEGPVKGEVMGRTSSAGRKLSRIRFVLASLGGADTKILAKAPVDATEMTGRGIAALIPALFGGLAALISFRYAYSLPLLAAAAAGAGGP